MPTETKSFSIVRLTLIFIILFVGFVFMMYLSTWSSTLTLAVLIFGPLASGGITLATRHLNPHPRQKMVGFLLLYLSFGFGYLVQLLFLTSWHYRAWLGLAGTILPFIFITMLADWAQGYLEGTRPIPRALGGWLYPAGIVAIPVVVVAMVFFAEFTLRYAFSYSHSSVGAYLAVMLLSILAAAVYRVLRRQAKRAEPV